ncbi:MAG TPA: mechanosensitive ion channel domain-containing protein [Polyangia bacterium]|nr:mechanosensitive ion channel domain-containing protein [Polyangia bacterium]
MNFGEVLAWLKRVSGAEILLIGDRRITVGSLFLVALILTATALLSRLARKRLGRVLERSGFGDKAAAGVLPRLAHVVILVIGVVMALQVIGIDLSTLFAAGAVFAVGLGFAMQNIMQNFVSGIILLAERSIKPGDVLEVEKTVVRVQRIGIRSTLVRTRSDEELIVPNSIFVQGTVKNFTLSDNAYYIGAEVGVSYGSDMRRVREVLETVARGVGFKDSGRESAVQMSGFGSSSVNWAVWVPVNDPWTERRLRSGLNEAIWNALAEAGITISFPQLDVHLDPGALESLRNVSGVRNA